MDILDEKFKIESYNSKWDLLKIIGRLCAKILSFGVIHFLTAYILLFGIFGAGAVGGEEADQVYQFFLVKHFPIIFPSIIWGFLIA